MFCSIFFLIDFLQKQVWINKNGRNTLTSGELWIQFLRYYTEQFDYEKNVVTIRQLEPLRRDQKGWFHQTIAIEDPFILTHNLADKLSLQSKCVKLVFYWKKVFIFSHRMGTYSSCIYSS